MALVMSMGIMAFAADGDTTTPGTPSITIKPNVTPAGTTESTTIKYTYYKILTASIDTILWLHWTVQSPLMA